MCMLMCTSHAHAQSFMRSLFYITCAVVRALIGSPQDSFVIAGLLLASDISYASLRAIIPEKWKQIFIQNPVRACSKQHLKNFFGNIEYLEKS